MNVPPMGTNVRREAPVLGVSMGANWVGACWVVPAKMAVSTVGARCRRVLVWAGVVSRSGTWGLDTSGSDVEASDIGRLRSVRIASISVLGQGFRVRDVGGKSNGDWAMSGSK